MSQLLKGRCRTKAAARFGPTQGRAANSCSVALFKWRAHSFWSAKSATIVSLSIYQTLHACARSGLLARDRSEGMVRNDALNLANLGCRIEVLSLVQEFDGGLPAAVLGAGSVDHFAGHPSPFQPQDKL